MNFLLILNILFYAPSLEILLIVLFQTGKYEKNTSF